MLHRLKIMLVPITRGTQFDVYVKVISPRNSTGL